VCWSLLLFECMCVGFCCCVNTCVLVFVVESVRMLGFFVV